MIEKVVVSRDDGVYEFAPDLAQSRSGRLVCIFAQTIHHMNRNHTCLMLTHSDDRGRSWSQKRPLTEPTTGGFPFWNCPRISALSDGRLVALADKICVGKLEAIEHPEMLQNHMFISEDEGNSFSEPILTPAEGIVPDQLIELSDGRWILSAQIRNFSWDGIQRLWYSDDQGKSWSDPVVVGYQKGLRLCEVSILPMAGDTLVALHRENSWKGWDCFKTISADRGESWGQAIELPLPGCHRPVAGHLDNGQVLVGYRFLQGGRNGFGIGFQNFFAAMLTRDSILAPTREEASARTLPIDYDRSPEPDLGYCGWTQFDDGEIFMVQYIVDDAPKAQIRGYSLTTEDFVLSSARTADWELDEVR